MEVISVIIPVYNVEKYLVHCVTSVINQTYSKLDIVLVDDGSTDTSGKLADLLAMTDDRISVFHKENGGLSSARNYGISKAKGDYIFFLDSDDYIELDCIEVLFNALVEERADLSLCYRINIHEENGEQDGAVFRKKECRGQEGALLGVYDGYMPVTAWGKIYKKRLFNHVRFPEGQINEDEAILFDILLQCEKVVNIGVSKYYYLRRKSGIMGSGQHINNIGFLDVLLKRDYLLEETKLWEIQIRNAIYAMDYYCDKYQKYGHSIEKNMLKRMRKDFLFFLKKYHKYIGKKRVLRGITFLISPKLCLKMFVKTRGSSNEKLSYTSREGDEKPL